MSGYEDAARKLNGLLNGAAQSAEDSLQPAKPIQATVSNITDDGVYVKTDGDNTQKGPFKATIMPKIGDRVGITNIGGTWTVAYDYDDPGASGTFVQTETGKVVTSVDEIRAGVGKFDELYATSATFAVVVAEDATLEELQAAKVYADSIDAKLVAAPQAQFGEISASTVKVDDISANVIKADYAALQTLYADVATFGQIGVKYAQIDAANIDNATVRSAWIDQVMVQGGMIAKEGTIYYLDAIKVNAVNIVAGTIDVERIVVTDSVTGDKHMVTWNSSTQQYEAVKLDGDVIEDLTITADKIVAGAITADKITANDLVGTGGWINLHSGTFGYMNAVTGQGIAWNGLNLYISGNTVIGDSGATLAQAAQNTLAYDHTFTKEDGTYTFEAFVRKGGEYVTDLFDEDMFVWYLRTETGDEFYTTGKTMTISEEQAGYRASIVGGLEEVLVASLVDESSNNIVTDDGYGIAIYGIWEV